MTNTEWHMFLSNDVLFTEIEIVNFEKEMSRMNHLIITILSGFKKREAKSQE
jgi:hypothetical protein